MSPERLAQGADAQAAEKCPVDHKSREAWMQQAHAARQTTETPSANAQPASAKVQTAQSSSTWSWRIPFLSSEPSQPPSQPAPYRANDALGTSRVVSTIPRSSRESDTTSSSIASTHAPANSEGETGSDKSTGNWIYPSEKMFFDAMRRKGHGPQEADMRTIVPIHNAVNERAWQEIKSWEAPYKSNTCPDGPRLESFNGLSTQMSPKARLKTLMGYTAPFDRHDWVVDRCGQKVDYVIDFYAGNDTAGGGQGKISFYLDVRPKLNSWEGVKMRASRSLGLA